MGDAGPESVLTALLVDEASAAVASLAFARLVLELTQPTVAFAEAGLTLTGLTLMRGLEQMEGWGTDFSSVALPDFKSGCTVKSDKRGQKRAISVDNKFRYSGITVMID